MTLRVWRWNSGVARACSLVLGLVSLGLGSLGLAGPVRAQTAPPMAPMLSVIDANGVNLFDGHLHVPITQSSIGGAGALGLTSQKIYDPNASLPLNSNYPASVSGQQDTLTNNLVFVRTSTPGVDPDVVAVSVLGQTENFYSFVSGGAAVVYTRWPTGGSLVASGGYWIYTRRDGLITKFPYADFYPSGYASNPASNFISSPYVEIDYPTGEVISATPQDAVTPPQYVESNLGYAMTANRQAGNLVQGICTYSDYCAGQKMLPAEQLGRAPTITGNVYSGVTIAAAGTGVAKTYTFGTQPYTSAPSRVTSVTDNAGKVWNYAYSEYYYYDQYSVPEYRNVRLETVTSTDPLGHTKTVVSRTDMGHIESITTAAGTITYGYNYGANWLTSVTYPEGNKETFVYDARGNITEKHSVPKTSSGLSESVVTAGYDTTCSNIKTCNQPNWVKDARGNQTDYTYDANHGGVLTVTSPAVTVGGSSVRPQKRFTYGQFYAYYYRGGTLQQAATPVWRVTKISECKTGTAPSCLGTSDELTTTFEYEPSTSANNVRLLRVIKGTGAGGATATTNFGYDFNGDVQGVNGPMAGNGDWVLTYYDQSRWPLGQIYDADGTNPAHHRATKNVYRADGSVAEVQQGTVPDEYMNSFLNSFNILARATKAIDSRGRVVTEQTIGAASNLISSTSYSYLDDGSLSCTALRMNLSYPTGDACTANTAGSFGPDRITKTLYDSAGRPTSVTSAYGTSVARTQTTTYTANGKTATVSDGAGNTTSYVYDGLDRLSSTRFPSATTGAGTSDTGDHEDFAYDADGNKTSFTRRDGQVFSYTLDALGRMTAQSSSTDTSRNLTFKYDLASQMTSVAFTASSSSAISLAYDYLGRKTSETGPNGTVASTYDLRGSRTSLTWPDSFQLTYGYDELGELTGVYEGSGTLATMHYDDYGRRDATYTGNGSGTFLAFDNDLRPSIRAFFRPGVGLDYFTYTYNPAGQTLSRKSTNQALDFLENYAVTRSYTNNGKNRVTASGSDAIAYDGRGNINSAAAGSTSTAYVYDVENHLTGVTPSAGTASSLTYDPLGRLSTITTGSTATTFVYDGDHVIAEKDGSGTVLRRYAWGPGADEVLVWYEGASNTDRRWPISDEKNSTVLINNGSGAAMAFNTYDEYGVPGTGNLGRFQYTGQAWIAPLGLYHYKARAYSPTLGRFMQTDPIGYGDGLNMYAYTHGDPINWTDPSGLVANSGQTCTMTGGTPEQPEIIATCVPGGGGGGGGAIFDPGLARALFDGLFSRSSGTNTCASFNIVADCGAVGRGAAAQSDFVGGVLATTVVTGVVAGTVVAGVVELTVAEAVGAGSSATSVCCFAKGTLVDTDRGLRPIDTIKVGDRVLSRDEVSGVTVFKPVTALVRPHQRLIWEVRFALAGHRPDTIFTTDDHPWRDAKSTWVHTDHLIVGEPIVRKNGTAARVLSVKPTARVEDTFNLEVADFHTYFVGNDKLWVHNACNPVLPNNAAAKSAAQANGWTRVGGQSKGAPIFKDPNSRMLFTRDLDGHSPGAWKGATKVSDLWTKATRSGTYDITGNWIGE